MSGHLLSTVNPEAGNQEYEVPPVGSRVVYYGRPGENGTNGQKVFAADVLSTDPTKGSCVLWVLRGREDYREVAHVYRRSDQNPYGCWDYIEDGFDALADDLAKLTERFEHEVASIRTALFGEFNPIMKDDGTPKSVYDLLEEFEQRVFAAEQKKK